MHVAGCLVPQRSEIRSESRTNGRGFCRCCGRYAPLSAAAAEAHGIRPPATTTRAAAPAADYTVPRNGRPFWLAGWLAGCHEGKQPPKRTETLKKKITPAVGGSRGPSMRIRPATAFLSYGARCGAVRPFRFRPNRKRRRRDVRLPFSRMITIVVVAAAIRRLRRRRRSARRHDRTEH